MVTGDVTNTGGSVAPGTAAAAGAISISGSGLGIYSQSATGAYNVKIGGTAAGQFDTLAMSGAATLGGPLNVSLINAFSPALGNTFTILTAASVTGTFSTANLPALSTGLGWQVTYNPTNVILSVVTVSSPVANLNPGSVPFPNTIVNTASAIQKVQLQNTGTAALIITSIQPTGPDAANYSYTPDATQPCPMSPATLGIGAICMLDVGFLPLTAGPHNNAQTDPVTDNSGNVVWLWRRPSRYPAPKRCTSVHPESSRSCELVDGRRHNGRLARRQSSLRNKRVELCCARGQG